MTKTMHLRLSMLQLPTIKIDSATDSILNVSKNYSGVLPEHLSTYDY